MTRAEFMRSMRTLPDILNNLRVLQQVYTTAPRDVSEEFFTCAFAARPHYSLLYRTGLRNRDYNFLLTDYSYLQFWHSAEANDLALRFAYYSNPFALAEQFADEESLNELDYEQYLQLLEEEQSEPITGAVVRYDVSFRDYIEGRHPAAHLHIGLGETGRWPVDKVLTPVTFTLLILKLFYPHVWVESCDMQMSRAKQGCAVLSDVFFTNEEKRHLYIT